MTIEELHQLLLNQISDLRSENAFLKQNFDDRMSSMASEVERLQSKYDLLIKQPRWSNTFASIGEMAYVNAQVFHNTITEKNRTSATEWTIKFEYSLCGHKVPVVTGMYEPKHVVQKLVGISAPLHILNTVKGLLDMHRKALFGIVKRKGTGGAYEPSQVVAMWGHETGCAEDLRIAVLIENGLVNIEAFKEAGGSKDNKAKWFGVWSPTKQARIGKPSGRPKYGHRIGLEGLLEAVAEEQANITRVRELLAQGLSQRQISEMTNLNRRTVQQIAVHM